MGLAESAFLSVYLSLCLSVGLSVCLSGCLDGCLPPHHQREVQREPIILSKGMTWGGTKVYITPRGKRHTFLHLPWLCLARPGWAWLGLVWVLLNLPSGLSTCLPVCLSAGLAGCLAGCLADCLPPAQKGSTKGNQYTQRGVAWWNKRIYRPERKSPHVFKLPLAVSGSAWLGLAGA